MTKMVVTQCLNCQQDFEAQAREIKRGNGKFCSISCSSTHRAKMIRAKLVPNCICAQCGEEFYRNASKRRLSKSGLQFCNRICKEKAQRIGGIKAIQPDHYNNGSGARYYRNLALRHYPHKCNRCGYSKCLSVIEAHHKDHDRSNNQLENLELLCRNCHGEEHHLDVKQ